MYSTDGGEILYHTKSHFIKLLIFFPLMLIISFLNKIVLISGASGSIGSKFSINLIKYKYKKLYLLDKNENDLTS